MPRDTSRETVQYARIRFLFSCLYLTRLRRFEMAKAHTSDLRFKRGQWWLEVLSARTGCDRKWWTEEPNRCFQQAEGT